MTEFEEQTPSADIIDATQSAVIDAVNSVSQLIEKQTQSNTFQETPTPHEAFYLSSEFWVGMAFVLTVIFISRPVFKALKGLLEKRRLNIINTLNEAEELHIEAQKLLASYERQFQNASNEIKTLAEQAQSELDAFAAQKNDSLEKELLKRQTEAENRIKAVTDQARAEMRTAVSKKTAQIVSDYITQNLNTQKRTELIDGSIERILEKLS